MHRAFFISILAHVLAIVSLFEFRPLPAYSLPVSKGQSLTVDFVRLKAPAVVAPNPQHNMPTSASVTERHSERRVLSTSSGERRPFGAQALAVGELNGLGIPPVAIEKGLAGLPAELESEYRLNIARELRRARTVSQVKDELRHEGSVRLIISYWAGLHLPVVSLDQSSGYPGLDEMALSSLNSAVARVRLPGPAIGWGFRVPYVVEYCREC
jgi:hypothetical protein